MVQQTNGEIARTWLQRSRRRSVVPTFCLQSFHIGYITHLVPTNTCAFPRRTVRVSTSKGRPVAPSLWVPEAASFELNSLRSDRRTMGKCPDKATSGFFNKLCFGWMNGVVRKARRGEV